MGVTVGLIIGTVILYCAVCGKRTKHYRLNPEKGSKTEKYKCCDCNVIQSFKTK